jgi:hypothetical protein
VDKPPNLAERRGPRPPVSESPAQPASSSRSGAPQESAGGELPLWHVSVTFGGAAVDLAGLDAALRRLVEAQPFLASVRYSADRAEVSYWDEAEDVDDAAALALRLWAEYRRAVELPDWRPVGIEVVDRQTLHARGQRLPPPTTLGEVRPW